MEKEYFNIDTRLFDPKDIVLEFNKIFEKMILIL